MRAFVERFLPVGERRTALWLALGGTAVMWTVAEFGFQVMERMPVYEAENAVPLVVAYAVQALAQFAAVALLLAVLIRVARAPRALALFVSLGAVVAVVLEFINLVGNPVAEVLGSAGAELGTALGAVVGAWVASTVTLARMADTGFSGDDEESGAGLKRKPGSRGWGFIGWEGRPLTGDALLVVAFVALAIIPALVTAALNVAVGFIPMEAEPSILADALMTYGGPLVVFIAWFFSAKLVSQRTGVVSLWTAALGSVLVYVLMGLWYGVPILGESLSGGLVELAGSMSALGVPAAALLGTALALRTKPATLSASGQQDPGTRPSDDTAGGTDG
ncbi:MAG: hypothetical protein CVT67_07860 [Actinobacteria bacterium HGW-Actinobacteria-7]|jgi:hypothetical protein|nr:MAG: hypothetical protein CVT67_07860 [Actinobacteria bacterium HGW-Actinobacteria-7]